MSGHGGAARRLRGAAAASGGQRGAGGLPVGWRFVGTPRVGFGSSAYGRTYQFGYRLGALGVEKMDFELGVDGHRRESPMLDGGDLGVLGRASVRWPGRSPPRSTNGPRAGREQWLEQGRATGWR